MGMKKQYSRKYDPIINYLRRSNDEMLNSLVLAKAAGNRYPYACRVLYENLRAVLFPPGEKNKNTRKHHESVLRHIKSSKQFEFLKVSEMSALVRQKYNKKFKKYLR